MTMAQIQKWNWDHRQRLGMGKNPKRKMKDYEYLNKNVPEKVPEVTDN